ncbi:MAG: 6-carboxytetrahydropterin synthase [Cyanobacteria bacterium P01_F01_bin.150]
MGTVFDYDIRYTLTRQHYNPPVSPREEIHFHDFEITLELRAQRQPPSIYGLDMVNVANQLKAYADQIPLLVNDHPDIPTGTTEQMCEYFVHIPLDSHIQLLSVSVSECPERVTRLRINPA